MPNWPLEQWIVVAGTPIIAMLGVVLTFVTLPGTWLIVLWSLGVAIWQPDVVPWWVVVILGVLAAAGEALEFLASAVGAAAGAVLGEMAIAKRNWEDSKKIAKGAAIGRLLSMLAKGLVAVIMGMVICLVVVLR